MRGIVGAIVGGIVGYFAFDWLASKGFYAMVMPGAAIGLACGYASGIRSPLLGAICALLALPLSLICESWVILADDSLDFLLKNLGNLGSVTWMMISAGTVMSFWFGIGRER